MCEWDQFEAAPGVSLRVMAGEHGIHFIDLKPEGVPEDPRNPSNPMVAEAIRQLRAYFGGELTRFDLPLDLRGTSFQLRVWQALQEIPYGATCSYMQLATAIGAPRAVRAVGAANGSNPIPIVVPCHRVIGSGGKLVGYGGGLPLKRLLLDLEAGRMRIAL
jgi:O-6-methylguanine DNA methyltransferase